MNSFLKKIKSYKNSKVIFFAAADFFIVLISVWLSFFLRFDSTELQSHFLAIRELSFFSLLFLLPLFYYNNLYAFSWAYVSAEELLALFKSLIIGFALIIVAIFFSKNFPAFEGFPRSVLAIHFLLTFFLSGALRLSKRFYLHIISNKIRFNKNNTLIIGAGDSGEQILRSIISSRNTNYKPVGFIDDSDIKQKVLIHGVKVLGKLNDLSIVVKKYSVRQIIIALPFSSTNLIKKAVELSRNAGVYKIKIIPPFTEIVQGNVSLKNLKNVDIEDLLGREAISLDDKIISVFLNQKKVLVTGAAGSIGSELCRQISKFNPAKIVLLDQDETGIFNISKELKENFPFLEINSVIANIRDEDKIKDIFQKYSFDVVFHSAAYKHVPLMEENIDEAIKNNIFGTEILVRVSSQAGVNKFIFISTDKAVNPTSVMGITKRLGEMICCAYNQRSQTQFISVRFGNVLNSRGSVIPIFNEQIKKGGPVEVTDPRMKRYFMLLSEACLLVMEAGARGGGGEVFVLDMGKPIMILDLAKEMIRLSGLSPDKDIAITFVGIRPGEKLFEEILNAEEGTLPTPNKRILIAKLSSPNFEEFTKKLEIFKRDIITSNSQELIVKMKNIILNYK